MGTQLEAAREIIGAVAQPTWMVEMSGTIALINAAALSTLGYANADDLVGRNSHGTLHGWHVDGRPYDEAECPMVSKVVAPEPVQEGREWMTRSDESMIPVRWSSRHLMIDSLPMTMLTITDLSEGRSDVGTARRSRPSTDTEHRRRLFHAISSYVFTRAHDPLTTPQSIARAHGMSLRYLQAIFAENGATPAHHLRRCRLELAAHELTEHRSSSEAAARSGFSDPATFRRAFRRSFGMSPSEFTRSRS